MGILMPYFYVMLDFLCIMMSFVSDLFVYLCISQASVRPFKQA